MYIKSTDDYAGAHAVALIGWGTDGGVDYWHLANSWGKGWGESGYGRIRRGTEPTIRAHEHSSAGANRKEVL